MKRHLPALFLVTVAVLGAPGCRVQPTPVLPAPNRPATVEAPTVSPARALSTYTDATYGYSFDYPSEWMLDEIRLGDRAPAGYQLTSWTHAPGMVSEVIEGGTIMNIGIQLWEPKGDLDAFVEHRRAAWQSSGTIVSSALAGDQNGRPTQIFVLRGSDGAQSYELFATIGEDYLFASGEGEIELVDLVARSIR